MTDSRRLAGLIGPTLTVIGASEVWTYRIWRTNIAPLVSLNGALMFVAGLSIVRVHNRWTASWPIVITLVGWVGILGGLSRMFAPKAQLASENAPTTIATASLAGATGICLTIKAYGPTARPRATSSKRTGA